MILVIMKQKPRLKQPVQEDDQPVVMDTAKVTRPHPYRTVMGKVIPERYQDMVMYTPQRHVRTKQGTLIGQEAMQGIQVQFQGL